MFGSSLDKITNNPEGGKLELRDEKTGKVIMTFTMPEKSKRLTELKSNA